MSIYKDWLEAKQAERAMSDHRRQIEDQLIAELGVSEADEGSQTFKPEGYKVKVTTRFNRKVDGDAVQALADESGIGHEHLQALFRWKPELNMKQWQAADPSITKPLEAAITTKPGRPSFSIETVEDK